MKKSIFLFLMFFLYFGVTNSGFLDGLGLNKKEELKIDFSGSLSISEEEAKNQVLAGYDLRKDFINKEEEIRKQINNVNDEELKKELIKKGKMKFEEGKKLYQESKDSLTSMMKEYLKTDGKKTKKQTNKKKINTNISGKIEQNFDINDLSLCKKYIQKKGTYSNGYSYVSDDEFSKMIGEFLKVEIGFEDEPDKISNMYTETYLNFLEEWNKYIEGSTMCEKLISEKYNQFLDIISINSIKFYNNISKKLQEKNKGLVRKNLTSYLKKNHHNVIKKGGVDNIILTGSVSSIQKTKTINGILKEFGNNEGKMYISWLEKYFNTLNSKNILTN